MIQVDATTTLARTATFVGVLAFAVAGALCWVALWMRRAVLRPLDVLADGGCSGRITADDRCLASRSDVIGRLARRCCALTDRIDEERKRANRAEASANASVEQQTRRMSAQLKKLKKEATRDALTGLANRRFIEERLPEVYDDFRSRDEHVAVVMLDVDNFKTLNDTEGHAAGDMVLRFLGELLGGAIRETDVAARYGGDEFMLILSRVTTEQARAVVGRIVRMFAQRVTMMPISTVVTLSAGLANSATFPTSDVFELVRQADEALYQSKRAGKNLVNVAQ